MMRRTRRREDRSMSEEIKQASPSQMRQWLAMRARGSTPEHRLELDEIARRVEAAAESPESWKPTAAITLAAVDRLRESSS